jgi:hypothetical protein
MDLLLFLCNYTQEIMSLTLHLFICLLNSLRLMASQLQLNVSQITPFVCELLSPLYPLGNINLEESVFFRILSLESLFQSHLLSRLADLCFITFG